MATKKSTVKPNRHQIYMPAKVRAEILSHCKEWELSFSEGVRILCLEALAARRQAAIAGQTGEEE